MTFHAEVKGKEREAAFRALESKMRTWMRRYPNSPSASIAYSMALLDHGFAYRGDDYAYMVEPENWAPFRKYVRLARENLERQSAFATIDPMWNATMLTIARLENWDRKRFDRLLNEALDREPLFFPTYFNALEYLLPKWHGGLAEIEAFAQQAVERTSQYEGKGIYARVYWFASQTQFQNDIFMTTLASWRRMKEGFEDVIAYYPDAWNLNAYAKFACLAGDAEKTRELLARIGSDVVAEAWKPESMHGPCADWAARQFSPAQVTAEYLFSPNAHLYR